MHSHDETRAGLRDHLRRRAGAMLMNGMFHGISSVGRLHPKARPSRHGVEVIRDVRYAVGRDLRLDVYRPIERAEPAPVVVYIHGGGFRILSKNTHWIMALAFARRGYVVFNIDYRLAPEHPFPAALEDSAEALAWVAKHAAEHGGDPSRLVLAGESAGANLATSMAIATSYARREAYAQRVFDLGLSPRAVIAACGMLQVTDPGRIKRRKTKLTTFVDDRISEVAMGYLGETRGRGVEARDLADPVCVLERGERPDRPLPPFFISVGTRDPLLDDSRRLKTALDGLDVESELRVYEGELHAFQAMLFLPNARRCWRDTYRFLDERLAQKS